MLATWILCIFIMLVIPAVTAQTGLLRLRSCSTPDAERGYRSELSLSSPEAWAYAQKACGPRYIAGGLLMAVLPLLMAPSLPVKTPAPLFVFTGTVVLFQTAIVVILIYTVESGLHKRFGKQTEAL